MQLPTRLFIDGTMKIKCHFVYISGLAHEAKELLKQRNIKWECLSQKSSKRQ